jgi:hypothetical protein
LLSALAAADLTTFATVRADGEGMNLSTASASSTFLPRTMFTMGRSLRGDVLMYFAVAFTSIITTSSSFS